MAETQVDFEFGLEHEVTIKPNGRIGKVLGMLIDRDEVHWFLVQYTDNVGMVHETYFRLVDLS